MHTSTSLWVTDAALWVLHPQAQSLLKISVLIYNLQYMATSKQAWKYIHKHMHNVVLPH